MPSRTVQILGVCLLLVSLLAIGLMIGLIVEATSSEDTTDCPSTTTSRPPTPGVLEWSRVSCFPERHDGEATEAECAKREGCVFDSRFPEPVPKCYEVSTGYRLVSTQTGNPTIYTMEAKTHQTLEFGASIARIAVSLWEVNSKYLRIKITDASAERWEVPVALRQVPDDGLAKEYRFEMTTVSATSDAAAFKITRVSTGAVIFDTGLSGWQISDQFLQISTRLPSHNVYGFGENLHTTLRHNLEYRTWAMFARDQGPSWQADVNLYGVQPFYQVLEEDGNAHGVFLLNSNAMEYAFTPAPALTLRTIGGVIDLHVFLGPTPDNVVQQYNSLVGPVYNPPYWALGFQLCKYGYNNLSNLQEAVDRTHAAGIPLDIQYADIDHFHERLDFTYDHENFADLPAYFQGLRDGGMRTVIILDPALISNVTGYEPYELGAARDVFVKWDTAGEIPDTDKNNPNNTMFGYVWPTGKVAFPDFFLNRTVYLWVELITKHYNEVPFDALWIDMNEPANFGTNEEKPWNWPAKDEPYWSLKCPTNKWDDPPYPTMAATSFGKRLSDKTLCMSALQGDGSLRMYNTHSLYGLSESAPTLAGLRSALPARRGFIFSRSTFPTSGRHSGHWLGDNDAQWADLRLSIIGMLEFNTFGMPYVGADICGFGGPHSTPELCKRWMQLGAFYPFSRNHNADKKPPQDPGYYGDYVAVPSREILNVRYYLLPYLYTLFQEARTIGTTVVRATYFEFPTDKMTWDLQEQFFWGPHLLVAPYLYQGATSRDIYLPKGVWYTFYYPDVSYYNKSRIYNRCAGGALLTQETYQNDAVPLFVRGGGVLPLQWPANNTHFSRQNGVGIAVALDCNGSATGSMFWDDGESIDAAGSTFTWDSSYSTTSLTLQQTVTLPVHAAELKLDHFVVYGVSKTPSAVRIVTTSGLEVNATFIHVPKEVLDVRVSDLSLTDFNTLFVDW